MDIDIILLEYFCTSRRVKAVLDQPNGGDGGDSGPEFDIVFTKS